MLAWTVRLAEGGADEDDVIGWRAAPADYRVESGCDADRGELAWFIPWAGEILGPAIKTRLAPDATATSREWESCVGERGGKQDQISGMRLRLYDGRH